ASRSSACMRISRSRSLADGSGAAARGGWSSVTSPGPAGSALAFLPDDTTRSRQRFSRRSALRHQPLVGGGIQEALDLAGIRDAQADHPALAEGVAVDELG